MKKFLLLGMIVSFLAAGCKAKTSPQSSSLPKQDNSTVQTQQSTAGNTNPQNNSMDTPKKQNLVLFTQDDLARNGDYIHSYAALDSGNFNDWFATIDSMVTKEEFVKQALAGNPYGYTTIDQVWPKLSEFYKVNLYPGPKTCSGRGFVNENYEGKDFSVDYCATDSNHVFGIRWIKNNQGKWLIVGISLAEKDSRGEVVTGGTSFSAAAGSKTDLATVQNHLREILKNN